MTDLKVGFCPADAKNFTEFPEIKIQSDIETSAEAIKGTYGADIFSDNGVCVQFDKTAKVFKYYVDPSKVKASNVPAAAAPTATAEANDATPTLAPVDPTGTDAADGMLASVTNTVSEFLSDGTNLAYMFLGAVVLSITLGIRQAYKNMNAAPNAAAPKVVKKPEPEVAKKASNRELRAAQEALKEGKLPTYDLLIQLLDGNDFKGDKVSLASLAPDDIAKRDQVRFNALTNLLANNPKTEVLAEDFIEKRAEIAATLDPKKGMTSETIMMTALKTILKNQGSNEVDIRSNLNFQVDHVVANGTPAQSVQIPKLDLPASFDELKTKAKITDKDDYSKQYEKIKLSVRGNKDLKAMLEKQELYLRENMKKIGSNFNVERALVKALEVSLSGDKVHFEEGFEFEVRSQHLAAIDSKRLSPDTIQKHDVELRRQREEIELRRQAIEAERAKRVAP